MNKTVLFLAIAAVVLVASCTIRVKEPAFNDTCSGVNRTAERNNCYVELAVSLNATDPCNSIVDNNRLVDSCYAETSIAAINRLGCHEIKNAQTRGYCQAKVGGIKAELPICENIDDANWKDVCYYDVAEATNKSEICSNIVWDSLSDKCFDTLARKINYGASCVFIKDSDIRDRCFLAVAISSKNPDLCNELSLKESGWTCFQKIAKARKDAKICELINTKSIEDNCRRVVNDYIAGAENST